mgnify:CR=1 FL=1
MFSDKVKEVTKKLYIFVTQINHELYLDRNGFKLHLDCIFPSAFVVALVKLVFLGDTAVFPEIINSTFASSKTAFEISLGLTGGTVALAGHHEDWRKKEALSSFSPAC